MVLYLLKFSACLSIFMLFYKMVLEQQNMHRFKRFYLLGAVVASMIIPAVTFTTYLNVETANMVTINSTDLTTVATDESFLSIISNEGIIWFIYAFGLIVFGTRFVSNIYALYSKIQHNPKLKDTHVINVLIHELLPPHTFFNYIFLNRKKFELNQIPQEVLIHEQTHAKEKHTFDVLFIELVQVILWFNPLIYLLKKDIKLNHEFLADRAVIDQGIHQSHYQNLLLEFSSNSASHQLANAINYSLIKKRFTVMKTHTSKTSTWLRSLVLLPLLSVMLYSFSARETVLIPVDHQVDDHTVPTDQSATPEQLDTFNTLANTYNAQPEATRVIPLKDLKQLESIYRIMSEAQKQGAAPFPNCPQQNTQDGATKEQIAEYNKLAKHYNTMSKDRMTIKGKDVQRLKYLYGLMTDKQKMEVEPFPEFPEPPEAPTSVKLKKLGEEEKVLPPPPPPIPENASPETKAHYKKVIAGYAERHPESVTVVKTKNGALAKVVEVPMEVYGKAKVADVKKGNENHDVRRIKGELAQVPSPPPPPIPEHKSPLDHIIEMAKKGAIFYLEDKKVSSDDAINAIKKDKNLNIQIREGHDKPSVVKISKKPIYLKDDH